MKVFLEGIGYKGNVIVNSNGVAPLEVDSTFDRKKMKESIGIPKNDKVVLFIGWFDDAHGMTTLMKSIPLVRKHLSDVAFVFVGEGPMKKSMKRYISKMKIDDCCFFTGIVPHEIVPSFIAMAGDLVWR